MIGKLALASVLSLALTPQPQASTTLAFTSKPYIERIDCDTSRGTGFKLADGRWVSAHHVTKDTGCKVDGIPITVTRFDERQDWSVFTVPGDRRRGGLTPDCSGYKDRQWVHGTGHAKGLDIVTSVPVMFSHFMQGAHPRDWSVLVYNRFIPGQSGGPVLNQSGQPVGIVNAFTIFFPASLSLELKRTPICSAPQ